DDVITICLPNIPSAFIAFYAVSKLGAIINMVHPLTPGLTLCKIMENTKSSIIFTLDLKFKENYEHFVSNNFKCLVCGNAHHLPKIKGVFYKFKNRKQLNLKGLSYTDYKTCQKAEKTDIVPDNDYLKPALYLHSGGTTGEPKTIVLSSFGLNSNSVHIPYIVENSGSLVGLSWLAVLPMYHGYGLSLSINGAFMYGMTSIAMPMFSPKLIGKTMKKIPMNYFLGVSAIYEALAKSKNFINKNTKNIMRCFCGGEAMSLGLKQRFDAALEKGASQTRLQEGYGLTEMVSVTAVNLKNDKLISSVGKALPGLSAITVDENNKIVKDGEICFAGDTQMLEYLNSDETTKKVFFEYDKKRFVKTGDYGYIDKNGNIFVKQRIKRIAKVNGITVFPIEIERYSEELDFVLSACAVSIHDKRCGEAISLFIILKDKNYDKEIAKTNLFNHLKSKLIKYAVPKCEKIFFIEDFPKTNVGKINFKKLEETAEKY
ncbi:MAG: acyl--CoA ligase, partial [Firmicutes bacterium]|nr:acyl--CoA ligase [Bacillota bacterium]